MDQEEVGEDPEPDFTVGGGGGFRITSASLFSDGIASASKNISDSKF